MDHIEYENFKSDELPYKMESGYTLTEINGACGKCNSKLTDLKFKVNDFGNCFELISVGICHDCKAIVQCSKIRKYANGTFTWYENGIWWTNKPSLLKRIIDFMKVW